MLQRLSDPLSDLRPEFGSAITPGIEGVTAEHGDVLRCAGGRKAGQRPRPRRASATHREAARVVVLRFVQLRPNADRFRAGAQCRLSARRVEDAPLNPFPLVPRSCFLGRINLGQVTVAKPQPGSARFAGILEWNRCWSPVRAGRLSADGEIAGRTARGVLRSRSLVCGCSCGLPMLPASDWSSLALWRSRPR